MIHKDRFFEVEQGLIVIKQITWIGEIKEVKAERPAGQEGGKKISRVYYRFHLRAGSQLYESCEYKDGLDAAVDREKLFELI